MSHCGDNNLNTKSRPPSNLSDQIREKVRALQGTHSREILTYQGPQPTIKRELNPDIDPEAFSDTRKVYETILSDLNEQYITDRDLSENQQLNAEMQRLNELAAVPSAQANIRGFKAFVRRVLARVIRFAISDDLARMNEVNATLIRSQNQITDTIRRVSASQRDFNAQIALFGQSIVPVIDEKVKYSFDTILKVIIENVEILVDRMDLLHTGLDRRQTDVLEWLENTYRELNSVLDRFGELKDETIRSLSLQHRKIESLKSPISSSSVVQPASVAAPHSGLTMDSYTYYLFEQEGRGSEQQIRERQKRYLEYFEENHPVLDIGCGRGEFLEILQAAGVPARGIDFNPDMVGICLDKGLNVQEAGAVQYLKTLDDASVGGIFSAQVVEHLDNEELIAFFKESWRTIAPDGLILLETMNTSSPFALFSHYYRDITHQRPRHPDTYKFLLKAYGFTDVSMQFLAGEEAVDAASPRETSLDDGSPVLRESLRDIDRQVQQIRTFIYAPQDVCIVGRRMEKRDGASGE